MNWNNIDIGIGYDDPTADPVRDAFDMVNNWNDYVESVLDAGGQVTEIFRGFTSGTGTLQAQAAASINAGAAFTIPKGHIGAVSFVAGESFSGSTGGDYTKVTFFIKTGAGTYGSGGTTLTGSQLLEFAPVNVGVGSSQIFELGDIGASTIQDFVNGSGPYVISGLAVFKATQSGTDKVWLFTGGNGTFGDGATAVNAGMFTDLTAQASIPSIGVNYLGYKEVTTTPYTLEWQDLNRLLVFTSDNQVVNITDALVEVAETKGISLYDFKATFTGTGTHTLNDPQATAYDFVQGALVYAICYDISGADTFWRVKPIASKTSELTNDGEDGVNPFITANDVPEAGADTRLSNVVSDLSEAEKTAIKDKLGVGGEGEIFYNIRNFGAKGDGTQHLDGGVASGSATFTSASASFYSSDIGKVIHIEGAGSLGGYLTTTILSINSLTSVEIATTASTTVSDATYIYGTDNTTSIQNTINACFNAGGGIVFVPNGVHIVSGSLQNNIGDELIDYNSQLYIPYIADATIATVNNLSKSTIKILGKTAPMPVQGGGLEIYPVNANLTCSVILSTIQGSGTKPSVLCSKGVSGSFPNNFNWINSRIENLLVLVTPNSDKKITIGGLNFFESITAQFENVTVCPYNQLTYNLLEPNIIDVDGISVGKVNCSKGNIIKNCLTIGFTNGFRVGEHIEGYGVYSSVCVNGILQEFTYQLSSYFSLKMDWCKNAIKINAACSINILGLSGEYKTNGKWFDTAYTIFDSASLGKGIIYFDIIEAGAGLNNNLFSKLGGNNLRCLPISMSLTDFEVIGETTDDKLNNLLNVLNRLGYIDYNDLQDFLAYYRFNSDLIDQVNAYNGTGTDITYVTGKSGNAANFNGTTSFMSLGDRDDFSFTNGSGNDLPFSMSFYIKFDTVTSAFIVQKRRSGAGNYEYQINYNGTSWVIGFYSGNTSNFLSASHAMTLIPGTWYHFSLTYDGSKTFGGMKLYIDGVSVTLTNTSVGSYTGMPNSNSPLILGYREENSDLFFDGAIDGFAIFNKELTPTEVTDNYNTQNGGAELK